MGAQVFGIKPKKRIFGAFKFFFFQLSRPSVSDYIACDAECSQHGESKPVADSNYDPKFV